MKLIQRFLIDYQKTLSNDVFIHGTMAFEINENGVKLMYTIPPEDMKMMIIIPFDYS